MSVGSILGVWLVAQVSPALAVAVTSAEKKDDSLQGLPWYEAVTSFPFPHLYSLDLKSSTFSVSLKSSAATYVMIDFFAPWCPHCQHFAPEFERLALTIQRSAREKTSVLIANVDCVRSADTCREWGIDAFPTLLWGKRSDWLANSTSKLEKAEFWPRVAEGAAQWINNRTHGRLDASRVSKDEVFQLLRQGKHSQTWAVEQAGGVGLGRAHPVATATADTWDAQLAVALLIHQTLAQQTFPMTKDKAGKDNIDGEKLRALLDVVALLAKRFPNDARQQNDGHSISREGCRSSLTRLHSEISHNWSQFGQVIQSDKDDEGLSTFWIDPDKLEDKWQLCGAEWKTYSQGWHSCRGTWPGKRGYTCGLWNTFHMVVARTNDKEAGRDLDVIRSALGYFFDCQECREHFLQIPVNAQDRASKRDVQLWWWTAHNFVNNRVGKIEEQFQDGDPAFPKLQWPTASVCPSCHRFQSSGARAHRHSGAAPAIGFLSVPRNKVVGELWNLDEVAAFLHRFYGEKA